MPETTAIEPGVGIDGRGVVIGSIVLVQHDATCEVHGADAAPRLRPANLSRRGWPSTRASRRRVSTALAGPDSTPANLGSSTPATSRPVPRERQRGLADRLAGLANCFLTATSVPDGSLRRSSAHSTGASRRKLDRRHAPQSHCRLASNTRRCPGCAACVHPRLHLRRSKTSCPHLRHRAD